jgi:hypothetical protein
VAKIKGEEEMAPHLEFTEALEVLYITSIIGSEAHTPAGFSLVKIGGLFTCLPDYFDHI